VGCSQLYERPLPKIRKYKPRCGSGLDDSKCTAILISTSIIRDEKKIKVEAKRLLIEALLNNELYIEKLDGDLYIGNLYGMANGQLTTKL